MNTHDKNLFIFIDDERFPADKDADQFTIVRTVPEAIYLRSKNK